MEIAKGVIFNNRVYELKAGKGINIDENNVISTVNDNVIEKLGEPKAIFIVQPNLVSKLNGELTFQLYGLPNIINNPYCYVDWGDGIQEYFTPSLYTVITHKYTDELFIKRLIRIYTNFDFSTYMLDAMLNNLTRDTIIYANFKYNSGNSANVGMFYKCTNLKGFSSNIPIAPGNQAFMDCSSLEYFDVPNGATGIGNFRNCIKLKEINIPSSILRIGVFAGCISLQNIIIPENVQSIASEAFEGCTQLKSIMIKAITPPTLEGPLSSTLDYIFVPAESLRKYKVATNWNMYINKIYPISNTYAETITIPSNSWNSDNIAIVEVIGATPDKNNVIEYTLIDEEGKQIEDKYNIIAISQDTMTLSFKCDTIPTEDIQLFIKSTLANYE